MCESLKNGRIFSDLKDRMFYEDDAMFCFFEEHPRAVGHAILFVKKHYEDMTYLPDALCASAFLLAKRVMNVLKYALGVKKVYLCTMCDGNVNHFHIQLIPRHPHTEIGSKNFVKPREEHIEDENLLHSVRRMLGYPTQ